ADTDSLTGPNLTNNWVIKGKNWGDLGPFHFDYVERLVGGNLDDTFQFLDVPNVGVLSIDGRLGNNWLDYSKFGPPHGVGVNSATGAPIVVNVSNVIGGAGNDSITGNGHDNILIGGLGDDTLKIIGGGHNLLIGGAGKDTLIGGVGEDILIGGLTAFSDLGPV